MTAVPLIDLGTGKYRGFAGGLYPGGGNDPPESYASAAIALGAAVQPLDKGGEPSPEGKIGLLCVGMSNASREFAELIQLVENGTQRNENLVLVDGAQDGAAATKIAMPFGDYWNQVEARLSERKLTVQQIQVVWLKAVLAYEGRAFPESARLLQRTLRAIVGILKTKFPRLKLIYVSSRSYGGYSKIDLSPEPIAYESGFAVKWLIEEWIARPEGDPPLLLWGPYLWADGLTPRSDGLIWKVSDFAEDGVHPSAQGAQKVAAILLKFFEKEGAAKGWF